MFSSLGEVELVEGRGLSSAQLEGVDVLLVRSVSQVDETLLADHPLQFVGSATSGIDHVDLEALARREIPFSHAPGSNADSVVDYVFSAIAQCSDKLEQLLAGAELGIVGYGRVGRRLSQRLQLLGIRSRACDPWLDADEFAELTSLEEVLACPVVCLHAELTRKSPWPSHHLLDAERLTLLREDALLINAGRGELIDTQALLDWLPSVPALELVLDVWEGEPLVDAGLLARCRFATPHIAGYSYDARLRATHMLYLALCRNLGVEASGEELSIEPVSVTIPAQCEGVELLRHLLGDVYDIREDDSSLRAVVPDSFDQLRRDYRRRRELGALHIENTQALSEEARQLCLALTCKPD